MREEEFMFIMLIKLVRTQNTNSPRSIDRCDTQTKNNMLRSVRDVRDVLLHNILKLNPPTFPCLCPCTSDDSARRLTLPIHTSALSDSINVDV